MKVLDLFSGIGGFSLGLKRAGMQTVQFCEVEPFCQAVLRKHWPDVPCHGDIRTLDATAISVDVVCGGFPCQDVSFAGGRAGLAGARSGLWFEFARVIRETRPRYAIIENVSALRSRGLDQVLWSLDAIGYDAEWHCIPASAVGAPHQRDRIWILAYPQGQRCSPVLPGRAAYEKKFDWWKVEPAVDRVADGVPSRPHRLRSLGNAVVPQVVEIIGRAIMNNEQET